METIEGLIRFWERTLFDFRYLMEPSTTALVELTILHLKKFQAILVKLEPSPTEQNGEPVPTDSP